MIQTYKDFTDDFLRAQAIENFGKVTVSAFFKKLQNMGKYCPHILIDPRLAKQKIKDALEDPVWGPVVWALIEIITHKPPSKQQPYEKCTLLYNAQHPNPLTDLKQMAPSGEGAFWLDRATGSLTTWVGNTRPPNCTESIDFVHKSRDELPVYIWQKSMASSGGQQSKQKESIADALIAACYNKDSCYFAYCVSGDFFKPNGHEIEFILSRARLAIGKKKLPHYVWLGTTDDYFIERPF